VDAGLTRRERVRLLRQLLQRLSARDDGPTWTPDSISVLFLEFGIDPPDTHDDYWLDVMTRRLSAVDDLTLQEMHETVFELPATSEEPSSPEPDAGGPWRSGLVRLFLSHSARHKEFAADVSEGLASVGVSAFVAHDAMEVTRPWQGQIERALRSAEAFAVLLHPEVTASPWCHQETGWALGRGLPMYAVRIGTDPVGFLGATQWPSAFGSDAQHVVRLIAGWLNSEVALSERVAGGLLASLRLATNYYAAESAAKALDALGTLTPDQWCELDLIFKENSQVGGSVLATRALAPLYGRASRSFPERA
jgi:hypothetical protein